MAKDLIRQQASQPATQPTLSLQRQPASAAQSAGAFSDAVDRQMTADKSFFWDNWLTILVQVIGQVLWPVYLFTEEAPALVDECKGLFTPAPGLDRLDHLLGIARRLTNIINGTLATLGVWAGLLALAGEPVAEFFIVGAYYAVSLVMIQVDVGIALAQLLKYWFSGSRAGVTQPVQSQYARMYSATAIGAIVTAALVALGIVAARFGGKVKARLSNEPVKPVEPAENPPPKPAGKPEDVPPVPISGRPNWNGKPCPPDFTNYRGFHGSDTPPDVVKANGGFGKGANADLKSHMLGHSSGDDAFTGTTSSPGGGHEGGGSSAWGTYVYEIDGGEAWDEPQEHSSGRQIIGERTDNPDYGKSPAKK